jgi:hypothetical protein
MTARMQHTVGPKPAHAEKCMFLREKHGKNACFCNFVFSSPIRD